MKKWLLVALIVLVPVLGLSADNKMQPSVKITNLDKLAKLASGYYVLDKYVNLKKKTYSTTKGFDETPIYGAFEIENSGTGIGFQGGNFREGLVFFDVSKEGIVSGSPCFDRFCISEVNPIDDKSFTIKVNGKDQKFISTNGFQAKK
jgi:hypothetical protein